MKLSKIKMNRLLKNGVSNEPLMLHGTGVESAIELFENGALLSGKVCFEDTKDHLFFVPVQERLKGTKPYKNFDGFTPSFAKGSAKMFAEVSAQDWYIIREIEKVVPDTKIAQNIMKV